ncbi:MAG: type II toxin-antitoxin system RelE/ParE family toxin [Bacteroidota bacterium]
MNFKIIPTDNFNKEVKHLAKKYKSIKSDLIKLREELIQNPTSGTLIGKNLYKVRMAISSKGKGKSGGARIISYVLIVDQELFLMSIYDKNEKDNISDADIKRFMQEINRN